MKKIKIFVITAFWPYGALSIRIEKFYPKLAKYRDFEIKLLTHYNTPNERKYLEKNRLKTVNSSLEFRIKGETMKAREYRGNPGLKIRDPVTTGVAATWR